MKPSDFVSTSGQKQDMSQSVLQTEMTDAVNSGIVGRADKSEKSLKSGLYSVGKRALFGTIDGRCRQRRPRRRHQRQERWKDRFRRWRCIPKRQGRKGQRRHGSRRSP